MSAKRRFVVRHSPRHRQRGGITLLLIMVLIVLAALVGVLAVRGATGDLQMAGTQRVSRTGFYCAEAGLNYARSLAAANPGDWPAILSTGVGGAWYPAGGITLKIDSDNLPDVTVVMRDNVDETGVAQDFTKDQDLTVILTATCNSTTLEANSGQRTLSQLVTYAGTPPTDYCHQSGFSSQHSGNMNGANCK